MQNQTTKPSVTPGLLYHDAESAIEWLCNAFGFARKLVVRGDAGQLTHAHLVLGNGGVMLSSAESYAFPSVCVSPRQTGGVCTAEIIVHVANPDAHFERACAAGAEVLIAIEDKPYGGRGYTCRDPEGHVWAFGSYDPWQ